MAAGAVLLLASCSEGQYWNEPADMGQVVAFTKPAASVSVASDATAPDSYTVTVSRSDNQGDLTVPVTLTTGYPDVLSGPESVTFANGSYTAEYPIRINGMMPGVNYSAKLAVTQPDEKALIHPNSQNLSFTFSISQALVWTKVGTTVVTSLSWAEGASGEVVIEEGNWPVAGERLFRMLDVYYAIEPDYAAKGTELRFFTDNAGNALRMGEDWSNIGEAYSSSDDFYFGCPAAYGCSFYNEGNVYVMDGVIGYGPSAADITPGWYETLYFQWDCPAK